MLRPSSAAVATSREGQYQRGSGPEVPQRQEASCRRLPMSTIPANSSRTPPSRPRAPRR